MVAVSSEEPEAFLGLIQHRHSLWPILNQAVVFALRSSVLEKKKQLIH